MWTFAAFRPLIEFYQNLPVGTASSNVLRKMSFRRSDAAKIAILSLPPQTSAVFRGLLVGHIFILALHGAKVKAFRQAARECSEL